MLPFAYQGVTDKGTNTVASGSQLHASGELQALVRDCIANNRQAQKKLYDTYAPVIYGVIRRYLNNQSAAEEVLNDTFYRVFTKLSQYAFTGPIEGWMRRIAINLITDHLRKHTKFEQEVHPEQMVETGVDADAQIGKLAYKELLSLIHELPATQRMVFNLYVFEDLQHREIGQLLQITENNSRWQLNDARRRLKEKINNLM